MMPTPPAAAARRAWAFALALLLLALVPRSVSLARFVTWDELFWTRAALEFHRELEGQDWDGTYIIGQPGVVTMWLGAGALAVRALAVGGSAPAATLEAGRLKYRDDDSATMATLRHYWRGLPIVIALFSSVVVALAYLWLRPLWGDAGAGAAAILLALDPFYVAHSRVFALDAVLAGLCLLSLAALARWLASGARRWLVAGAVLAGLATLNKVPALGVVAWGAMVVGVGAWRHASAGRSWLLGLRRAVPAAGGWIAVAAGTVFVGWPALWVEAAETVGKVAATLATYESSAYDAMFFAGTAGEPPGPGFYPAVALFRLSPLVWVGIAAVPWLAMRREGGRDRDAWSRNAVWVFGGFALLYGLLLTWPATKFERYLLPALLPVVALAGLGLGELAERWRLGERVAGVTLAGALAIAAGLLLLPTAPGYHLAWYNPLLGGAAAAESVLPLGWGEGMDQVAAFLAGRTGAQLGSGDGRSFRDGRGNGDSESVADVGSSGDSESVADVSSSGDSESVADVGSNGDSESVADVGSNGEGAITVASDGLVSLAGLDGLALVRAGGAACVEADYVVVYVFDRQLGRPAAWAYADEVPVFEAWVNGLPYASVYDGGRPCDATVPSFPTPDPSVRGAP